MPSQAEGAGSLSSVGDTAAELFISKGIPYLAKQGFEAGRYYASEAMRNPALQKKAINYCMKKARPAIDKIGQEVLDQLGLLTPLQCVHMTSITAAALSARKNIMKVRRIVKMSLTAKW